jgi:hypothetical protein
MKGPGFKPGRILFCRAKRFDNVSIEYSGKMTQLSSSGHLLLNAAEPALQALTSANLAQSELFRYSTELKNFKPKSPFIAGSLSAVVPGAGKVYTNNLEQGLISLFAIGLIGFRTVIEYNRGGVNSPGFVTFGLIFLFTYTGNIIGSAISARQYNEKYYNAFHTKVLDFIHEFD